MRALQVVVLLVVLAAVIGEVGARYLIQKDITMAVEARDPAAKSVAARVSFPLVYGLVAHHSIARVEVTAESVNVGPVVAAQVTATATGVELGWASLAGRGVHVSHIDRLTLVVTISAHDASAVLPPGLSFSFGQATVTLHTPLISINGRFVVQSSGRVAFVVGSPVAGLRLPALTFSAAPLPACLRGVTMTPGELTLTCAEANPPTGFLPVVAGG